MAAHPSTIFDDYEFISVCGAGSFGKVHKVMSKSTGKIYACKEINYGQMSTKEKELLVSEVNLLRKLDHQNIVKYISRYQDKAQTLIYVIMDFCANGDLAHYVKNRKAKSKYIEEDRVWTIFAQLLLALDYCHDPLKANSSSIGRVVHRDIKTANVFICDDGSIKIGDFGLCRALGYESMAKTNVGTPLYMAPELLNKQAYTEKVDVWSLGCVIYELCALQPPYVATSLESLKIKVNRGVRPFVPSHYSFELRKLIDLMLSKEPEKRPTTADLMQLPVVRRLLQGLNSQGYAVPEGVLARIAEPARPSGPAEPLAGLGGAGGVGPIGGPGGLGGANVMRGKAPYGQHLEARHKGQPVEGY